MYLHVFYVSKLLLQSTKILCKRAAVSYFTDHTKSDKKKWQFWLLIDHVH